MRDQTNANLGNARAYEELQQRIKQPAPGQRPVFEPRVETPVGTGPYGYNPSVNYTEAARLARGQTPGYQAGQPPYYGPQPNPNPQQQRTPTPNPGISTPGAPVPGAPAWEQNKQSYGGEQAYFGELGKKLQARIESLGGQDKTFEAEPWIRKHFDELQRGLLRNPHPSFRQANYPNEYIKYLLGQSWTGPYSELLKNYGEKTQKKYEEVLNQRKQKEKLEEEVGYPAFKKAFDADLAAITALPTQEKYNPFLEPTKEAFPELADFLHNAVPSKQSFEDVISRKGGYLERLLKDNKNLKALARYSHPDINDVERATKNYRQYVESPLLEWVLQHYLPEGGKGKSFRKDVEGALQGLVDLLTAQQPIQPPAAAEEAKQQEDIAQYQENKANPPSALDLRDSATAVMDNVNSLLSPQMFPQSLRSMPINSELTAEAFSKAYDSPELTDFLSQFFARFYHPGTWQPEMTKELALAGRTTLNQNISDADRTIIGQLVTAIDDEIKNTYGGDIDAFVVDRIKRPKTMPAESNVAGEEARNKRAIAYLERHKTVEKLQGDVEKKIREIPIPTLEETIKEEIRKAKEKVWEAAKDANKLAGNYTDIDGILYPQDEGTKKLLKLEKEAEESLEYPEEEIYLEDELKDIFKTPIIDAKNITENVTAQIMQELHNATGAIPNITQVNEPRIVEEIQKRVEPIIIPMVNGINTTNAMHIADRLGDEIKRATNTTQFNITYVNVLKPAPLYDEDYNQWYRDINAIVENLCFLGGKQQEAAAYGLAGHIEHYNKLAEKYNLKRMHLEQFLGLCAKPEIVASNHTITAVDLPANATNIGILNATNDVFVAAQNISIAMEERPKPSKQSWEEQQREGAMAVRPILEGIGAGLGAVGGVVGGMLDAITPPYDPEEWEGEQKEMAQSIADFTNMLSDFVSYTGAPSAVKALAEAAYEAIIEGIKEYGEMSNLSAEEGASLKMLWKEEENKQRKANKTQARERVNATVAKALNNITSAANKTEIKTYGNLNITTPETNNTAEIRIPVTELNNTDINHLLDKSFQLNKNFTETEAKINATVRKKGKEMEDYLLINATITIMDDADADIINDNISQTCEEGYELDKVNLTCNPIVDKTLKDAAKESGWDAAGANVERVVSDFERMAEDLQAVLTSFASKSPEDQEESIKLIREIGDYLHRAAEFLSSACIKYNIPFNAKKAIEEVLDRAIYHSDKKTLDVLKERFFKLSEAEEAAMNELARKIRDITKKPADRYIQNLESMLEAPVIDEQKYKDALKASEIPNDARPPVEIASASLRDVEKAASDIESNARIKADPGLALKEIGAGRAITVLYTHEYARRAGLNYWAEMPLSMQKTSVSRLDDYIKRTEYFYKHGGVLEGMATPPFIYPPNPNRHYSLEDKVAEEDIFAVLKANKIATEVRDILVRSGVKGVDKYMPTISSGNRDYIKIKDFVKEAVSNIKDFAGSIKKLTEYPDWIKKAIFAPLPELIKAAKENGIPTDEPGENGEPSLDEAWEAAKKHHEELLKLERAGNEIKHLRAALEKAKKEAEAGGVMAYLIGAVAGAALVMIPGVGWTALVADSLSKAAFSAITNQIIASTTAGALVGGITQKALKGPMGLNDVKRLEKQIDQKIEEQAKAAEEEQIRIREDAFKRAQAEHEKRNKEKSSKNKK